jgi:alkylhydroperoxidase family enzyme
MRLPYADPSTLTSAEDIAVVTRVEARRAPRPLQALDLTLLHAPKVADGWNSFLGAIRTGTSLAADVREIAICRVAVCNEAWYEWAHHAPLAKEGGVSEEGMRILGEADFGGRSSGAGVNGEAVGGRGICRCHDESRGGRAGCVDRLRKHFSEQEVVELTATVSADAIHSPRSHIRGGEESSWCWRSLSRRLLNRLFLYAGGCVQLR